MTRLRAEDVDCFDRSCRVPPIPQISTEDEEKTEEDLESEVKGAKNDDHTLGNPPVAHSIGERKRLAYGLGRYHRKGSQGQSLKRKAVRLPDTRISCELGV